MEIPSPVLPALEPRAGQSLVPVCIPQLCRVENNTARKKVFSFDEVPITQQLFQSVKWRHKRSQLQIFLSFSFLRHFLYVALAVLEFAF